MGRVRHSASAENDLLEAWLYVAEESIGAADHLLDRIEAEARTLLQQPKMGRARDELAATRFACGEAFESALSVMRFFGINIEVSGLRGFIA